MCGLAPGDVDPATASKVRLHIGHIKDKSLGGRDELSNLRALCSSTVIMEAQKSRAKSHGNLAALPIRQPTGASGCSLVGFVKNSASNGYYLERSRSASMRAVRSRNTRPEIRVRQIAPAWATAFASIVAIYRANRTLFLPVVKRRFLSTVVSGANTMAEEGPVFPDLILTSSVGSSREMRPGTPISSLLLRSRSRTLVI